MPIARRVVVPPLRTGKRIGIQAHGLPRGTSSSGDTQELTKASDRQARRGRIEV
ncbi:MAG: hypothetical protein J0I17_11220 ['Candidatus Kapabacteria' thiocyanatum]|nr:hypothetical protein ['Candidatus Kapabacteria' thiocyanatum]